MSATAELQFSPHSNDDKQNVAAVYAMVLAELPTFIHFMNAAMQLNLFPIISEYDGVPVSASQVASHLPTYNPEKTPVLLDRMMRLFSAFSLFNCTTDGEAQTDGRRLYSLSEAGKYFVKNKFGGSFAPLFIQHSDPILRDAWFSLKDAVLEGVSPSAKAYGTSIFQMMSQNPKSSNLFNRAMTEKTTITLTMLVETYKGFDGIETLVDIGGGNGSCLKIIISANPHIKGINFDLPHVIENAPPTPGITHVKGDMFISVPEGEAILLKNVLHNWGDENCLKLLKACYSAIPRNGKVIVIEAILPAKRTDGIDAKHACIMDCLMFIHSEAKERTKEEFLAMSRAGGFSDAQFVCCFGGEWVMEFRK